MNSIYKIKQLRAAVDLLQQALDHISDEEVSTADILKARENVLRAVEDEQNDETLQQFMKQFNYILHSIDINV